MSLIQVSSTQKQYSNEQQGKAYFGINQGYSFSNPFTSPLEIPPYSSIAVCAGTFQFAKENVVVGSLGGDDGINVPNFRLIIASDIPVTDPSYTVGLSLDRQVTYPLSQTTDPSGINWGEKYTTKCPLSFQAPQGTYGSQTEYVKEMVKVLNISSNPLMAGTFSSAVVNDPSFGICSQIIANPISSYAGRNQYIQGPLYSGFTNFRTNIPVTADNNRSATMSLTDISGGGGTPQAWYRGWEKTDGASLSNNPAVAQTNCTGLQNSIPTELKTGGIFIPAGSGFSATFSKPSKHRVMFGVSKAGVRGDGIEDGKDKKAFAYFNSYAGITATRKQTYERIYNARSVSNPTDNIDWCRFMYRMCSGNMSMQKQEIYEYALLIMPTVGTGSINNPSNYSSSGGGWQFASFGNNITEALDNGAGFKTTILKLQFNNQFGYFYMPVMTGDPVICDGGARDYNIQYSPELNPNDYFGPTGISPAPSKRFGVQYATDPSSAYVGWGIGLEGNNIEFLLDASYGVNYIDATAKSQLFKSEMSDINYPLQVKASICYLETKLTDVQGLWQTNSDGANPPTADMKALVFYGDTTDDFSKYVEANMMLPAWIYNRQYWLPVESAILGGGYAGCRTPNLCFDSLDLDLFDNFATLFPNELGEIISVPTNGQRIKQKFWIQVAPDPYFESQAPFKLNPNIQEQIGLAGIVKTGIRTTNAYQGEPTSSTNYTTLTALAQIIEVNIPFSSGVYIRLKNLPTRSTFGSINQTYDKLVAMVNRFDKFYDRDETADEPISVYGWEAYEKIYISLNNPAPIFVSSLDFDLVNRFGELNEQIERTTLLLHLKKDDTPLYAYDRINTSLENTNAYTI